MAMTKYGPVLGIKKHVFRMTVTMTMAMPKYGPVLARLRNEMTMTMTATAAKHESMLLLCIYYSVACSPSHACT